jgi:hypothetical protein
MPTPTFSLDFSKVGIRILVIDFQGKSFYELKTSLNSLRPSISELRSQQNEQKGNGVTQLRGQAACLYLYSHTPTPTPSFKICNSRFSKCLVLGDIPHCFLDCPI